MPGHDRSAAQARSPNPKGWTRKPGRSLLSCPLHGHDSLHDVKTSRGHTALFSWAARADLSSLRAAPKGRPRPSRHNPRLLVGLGRFERPTSRLSGVRSNQLSYRPGLRGRRSAIRCQTPPAAESDLRSPTSVLWKGCAGGGRGPAIKEPDAGVCSDLRPLTSDLGCRAGSAAL
jgi:hypothetical protein